MLAEIVRGGYDKVREAGAVLVGGHSVDDEEIKYGLSVTGLVEPGRHTSNAALAPGDELLLTKPLGMGVLAVAVKARWEGCDGFEETIWRWASRLNKGAGEVVRLMGLRAATDVTGFGLGGHLMEMARASGVEVEVWLDGLPLLDGALDLAAQGMVPGGSHANRAFCAGGLVGVEEADPVRVDLFFDAQTSGGLLMAVPGPRLDEAARLLAERGEMAAHVGRVTACGTGCGRLVLA
jgi:selenide,water dikinase